VTHHRQHHSPVHQPPHRTPRGVYVLWTAAALVLVLVCIVVQNYHPKPLPMKVAPTPRVVGVGTIGPSVRIHGDTTVVSHSSIHVNPHGGPVHLTPYAGRFPTADGDTIVYSQGVEIARIHGDVKVHVGGDPVSRGWQHRRHVRRMRSARRVATVNNAALPPDAHQPSPDRYIYPVRSEGCGTPWLGWLAGGKRGASPCCDTCLEF